MDVGKEEKIKEKNEGKEKEEEGERERQRDEYPFYSNVFMKILSHDII